MNPFPSPPSPLAVSALVMLALPLFAQPVPPPTSPEPHPMSIARIEPMPAPGDPIYARVVLSGAPPQADFQFTVNGQPAPFERLASPAEAEPVFQILVGPPGIKQVAVTAQSGQTALQASAPFEFVTNGGILLFGYFDHEILASGEELQLLTYFASDPLLRVNGTPVPLTAEPGADPLGLAIYFCLLPLQPGNNLLQYSATTRDGRRLEKSLTLYSFDNGQAHVGDHFRLLFGAPITGEDSQKTSLRIVGNALQTSGPAEIATINSLSDYSFLTTIPYLVQPIAAVQPGVAQIRILAQSSAEAEQLETQQVTVLP